MYATYVDRTSSGVPFYVGKGNPQRTLNLTRNNRHTNVSRKHGIVREIVLLTTVESIAYEREIELIAELNTFVDDPSYNGVGCNLTRGGEGHSPTLEMKKTYSKRTKARWNDPIKRAEWKLKMKGNNAGKIRTQEWKKKHALAMSGCGNPNYGKKQSDVVRKKNRMAHIGSIPWNKGLTMPESISSKRNKHIIVIDDLNVVHRFNSFKMAFKICFVACKLFVSYSFNVLRSTQRIIS